MEPTVTTPLGPSRKASAKRAIVAVVVSLLIGAVVNVGVAWGIAAWIPQRGWRHERASHAEVEKWWEVCFDNYRAIGASRCTWEQNRLSHPYVETPWTYAIERPQSAVRLANVNALRCLSWGRTLAVLMLPEAATHNGCDHATGWPSLCLWYGVNQRGLRFEIEHGVPLNTTSAMMQTALWDVRALPLSPLWPGFALNTLFYATIAWLLWRIPSLIRRHRRRARGLCIKCAYSRAGLPPGGGAPCPECGHTPPAVASAAPSAPSA